ERRGKEMDKVIKDEWVTADHVKWWGWRGPGQERDLKSAWCEINRELESLVFDMRDSRVVYLNEARAQDPAMRPYFAQLLGIDPLLKPWTGHLMRCATAVAHIAYMYFKGRFKRVRPSTLCPGLAVPFG